LKSATDSHALRLCAPCRCGYDVPTRPRPEGVFAKRHSPVVVATRRFDRGIPLVRVTRTAALRAIWLGLGVWQKQQSMEVRQPSAPSESPSASFPAWQAELEAARPSTSVCRRVVYRFALGRTSFLPVVSTCSTAASFSRCTCARWGWACRRVLSRWAT